MKKARWILCLGLCPIAIGCAGSPPERAPEAPAGEAAAAIGETAPPIVNPVHGDLGPKLSEYAGFPTTGRKTPGMIAAVVKGKHIVALGASGYAKIPDGLPMTTDMVFNIGSNTKSMAATLLSMLIEEHPTLTWNTTLAEALPWANLPGKQYIQPAARRDVTLRQVVAHRSGIACSYPGPDDDNTVYPHKDYPADIHEWHPKTHEQLLMEYLRGPAIGLNGTPTGILADCQGTIGEYTYENENFAIVQAVIDQWSGMSFLEYAQQKLIGPNGMGDTYLTSQTFLLAQGGTIDGTAAEKAYWNPYFFQPLHPYLVSGRYAWGHDESGIPTSIQHPDVDPWGIAPARGGFAFNIVDWARYAILHLRDTSDAITNVHVPHFPSYAYGWKSSASVTPGGIRYTSLCHTGAISGMQSRICVYPELDIAYLSFANGGPYPESANLSTTTWMASQPQYARDTGGCTDDGSLVHGVQRFWSQNMFGCAGRVTFPNRDSLCKAGHHVCSAAEFVANNSYGTSNAEAPKHHYWTDDNLKWGGSGSGSCWASTSAGSSCGTNTPMRVCAPESVDPGGNECNWVECGHGTGSTLNRHFGGCVGDTTAGALCCKD